MYPQINVKKSGKKLELIMKIRGVTVVDIKNYLGLTCVQSVYRWLNGRSMPTLDHLYSLSALLGVSMEFLVCGTKKNYAKTPKDKMEERLFAYFVY